MKKYLSLVTPALIGLAVFGLTAHLTARVYVSTTWLSDLFWVIHLIIPLLLMGCAIAAHLIAKGRTAGYLVSYFLNAVGSGCLVGAIYGLRGYVPQIHLLGALLPAALIVAATFLIPLQLKDLAKGITALVLAGLALALAVAGIFVWPFYSMPMGCCFLFSGLFILPFPLAVATLQEDSRQRFRYLSFSGFGTFALVIIVAAFILSDGDILDGLDGFDFSDIGSGKKKGK